MTATFTAKLSNPLHESVPQWMIGEYANMVVTGFLARAEFREIQAITGEGEFSTIFTDLSSSADLLITKIDIHGFQGAYAGSTKVPDYALRPRPHAGNGCNTMPTIVCEVGYSQSNPILLSNVELWLVGGGPTVSLVILVRFLRRKSRAACRVQVYRRDAITQLPVLQIEHVRGNPPRPTFTLLTCSLGSVGLNPERDHSSY